MIMNTMDAIPHPAVKINILTHYEALNKKRKTEAAKLEAEVRTTNEQIKSLQSKLAEHAKEKENKERCRAVMAQNGVNTTECDNQMASLDALMTQTQAEVEKLKQTITAQPQPPADILARATLLVEHLKARHKCEDAIRVRQADDCWQHLPVKLQLNEEGRPVECVVELGASKQRTVKIRPDVVRFKQGFRPTCLAWLETAEARSNNVEGETHSNNFNAAHVFVDDEGRVLISGVKCIVSKEVEATAQHSYCGRSVETRRREWVMDISEITTSLESCFDETAGRENGELDLNKSYADNGLMRHLRDFVLNQTIPELPFVRTDEELTSPEIYQRIKTHWDELARCPWSDSIALNLALLKYGVENGEKARFWVERYKNHYGFRLRTRDHSWIRGFIHIDPAAGKVAERKSMKVGITHWNDAKQWLATLGDMRLMVIENE